MRKFFAVAAVVFCSHLHAQKDTAVLNEVIITATKFPKRQNETGKVVTVIGRDILEKSRGKTIGEVLDRQAAITVIGAGSNPGTNQDVYIRGAGLGRSLVLIDGNPFYDPSTISAAFELNNISLDNVDRIEIVKGEQSTLYGSDAVAGVINIITKKGSNKPFNLNTTLSGGSYNSFNEDIGINGIAKQIDYNIHYNRMDSKGFSSAYDSTGKDNFQNNGFYKNALNGSFGIKLSDNIKARLYAQYDNYKADLDAGSFIDERDYFVKQQNAATGLNLSYKYAKGSIYLNYNFNRTQRNYLNDSGYIPVNSFSKYTKQEYTGRSHFAEIYTNYSLSEHIDLLAGADFRLQNTDQYYFSISDFGPYESLLSRDSLHTNQLSAYGSVILKNIHGFNFEAGGRYNHHSTYGSNVTYSINPSYLINNRFKLFANIASGYKAPTLYQLYAFNSRDLKPEKSRTIEGGIQFNTSANFWVRGVYFYRHSTNNIDYNNETNKYFNYNIQNDHGFELESQYKTDRILFSINYAYVTGNVNTLKYKFDPVTYSYLSNGDTSFNNLFRRPKNSLNVNLGYTFFNKLYVSGSAKIVGKRIEPVYGDVPIEMSSYHTFDFYTSFMFSRLFTVFADCKNITNTKYFEIRGYNSKGFNFMAGLHLSFY